MTKRFSEGVCYARPIRAANPGKRLALAAVDPSVKKAEPSLRSAARRLSAALEGFFAAALEGRAAATGQEAPSSGKRCAPKLFFGGLGGIAELTGSPFSVSVCNGSFLALEGSYEDGNRG